VLAPAGVGAVKIDHGASLAYFRGHQRAFLDTLRLDLQPLNREDLPSLWCVPPLGQSNWDKLPFLFLAG
jgi:hypothetical protein